MPLAKCGCGSVSLFSFTTWKTISGHVLATNIHSKTFLFVYKLNQPTYLSSYYNQWSIYTYIYKSITKLSILSEIVVHYVLKKFAWIQINSVTCDFMDINLLNAQTPRMTKKITKRCLFVSISTIFSSL